MVSTSHFQETVGYFLTPLTDNQRFMEKLHFLLAVFPVVATPAFSQILKHDRSVKDAPALLPPPSGEVVCEFINYEEPPRFPGCEDLPRAERNQCAEKKMMKFIWDNFRYPDPTWCGSGRVVVSFMVEKDGGITGAKIMRDIGGGMAEEVLRVVGLMPPWVPGKQRGVAVRTQFNLPVRVCLE